MRKRKRLLRVALAAGLLVLAVPSAAAAFNLTEGSRGAIRAAKAECSLDPRLLKMEPGLCGNNQVPSGVTTFDEVQGPSDGTETRPVSSDRIENEIGWWMVAIAVAASGAAGLIVGLRRGRPHALS